MESLDVSSAFLQGIGFDLLERVCKALGVQLPEVQRPRGSWCRTTSGSCSARSASPAFLHPCSGRR
eukprot:10600223-Lingulodinium_polyedra.AAC.1